MDDASLDEFLNASGDESEGTDESTGDDRRETDDTAGAETSDGDTTRLSGAAIDPASATSRWDPEGNACENCNTTVERLWRDDGWVCRDCKEW